MTTRPGTTYHPETALLMARLCGLVYQLPGESEWTWEARFRYHLPELLEAHMVELVADDHDLAAVIDGTDWRIVVVRGTNDAVDWIKTNFHIGFDLRNDYGVDWRVHGGFQRTASILNWLMWQKHLPDKPTWFTGHSLGGAVATIMALNAKNMAGATYTFGSPRTFDAAGAELADDITERMHYRHYCYSDLVPHTPCSLRGYRHCGQSVYLDRAGEMHAAPSWRYRVEQTLGAWLRDMAWLFEATDEGESTSTVARLLHIFGSKYHRISHYAELLQANVNRLKGEAA